MGIQVTHMYEHTHTHTPLLEQVKESKGYESKGGGNNLDCFLAQIYGKLICQTNFTIIMRISVDFGTKSGTQWSTDSSSRLGKTAGGLLGSPIL